MHICMHYARACTYVCTVFMHADMHAMCSCMHACMQCIHACTYACMHAMYSCMHACMHTCIYACIVFMHAYYACSVFMHAHMHACMHTHMHAFELRTQTFPSLPSLPAAYKRLFLCLPSGPSQPCLASVDSHHIYIYICIYTHIYMYYSNTTQDKEAVIRGFHLQLRMDAFVCIEQYK